MELKLGVNLLDPFEIYSYIYISKYALMTFIAGPIKHVAISNETHKLQLKNGSFVFLSSNSQIVQRTIAMNAIANVPVMLPHGRRSE